MRVEYTLEPWDHVAFYAHYEDRHYRHSRRFRARMVLRMAVTHLAVFGGAGLVTFAVTRCILWAVAPTVDAALLHRIALGVALAFVALVVVSFVLALLTGRTQLPRGAERFSRGARQRVQELLRAGMIRTGLRHALTLDPAGLTEVWELPDDGAATGCRARCEFRATWGAVEAVEATTGHVFFITAGAGWLVVPRTAFASLVDYRGFIETARRLREGARTVTAITATRPAPQGGPSGLQAHLPRPGGDAM